MSQSIELKIKNVVDAIMDDVSKQQKSSPEHGHARLDKQAIIDTLNEVQKILLPAYYNDAADADFAMRYELGGSVERVYSSLRVQIAKALQFHPNHENESYETRLEAGSEFAGMFLDRLTEVREYLKTDIQAAFDGDPAAYNKDEIVYSYPGFYAITVSRIAHELYVLGIPLIPRIMTEHAHSATGIDIHPGASIGKYFFIDHGTGVVIGETTVIGEHVKIYQGVTLGGLSTRAGQGLKGVRRHPTIGNDVTIYSNASILGGETIIGDDCVIGGNCFITSSVQPHSRVSNQAPQPEISDARKRS